MQVLFVAEGIGTDPAHIVFLAERLEAQVQGDQVEPDEDEVAVQTVVVGEEEIEQAIERGLEFVDGKALGAAFHAEMPLEQRDQFVFGRRAHPGAQHAHLQQGAPQGDLIVGIKRAIKLEHAAAEFRPQLEPEPVGREVEHSIRPAETARSEIEKQPLLNQPLAKVEVQDAVAGAALPGRMRQVVDGLASRNGPAEADTLDPVRGDSGLLLNTGAGDQAPAQLPQRSQHGAPFDRIPSARRHEAGELAQLFGKKAG